MTEDGIFILDKELQSLKQNSRIRVTDDGITIFSKEVQKQKLPALNVVTEEDISTLDNDEHPKKQYLGIELSLFEFRK